jgi:uncharacterized NAD(P)/FAD-binding protein YdhS
MYNYSIMTMLQWIITVGAAASALGYIMSKFLKLFKTWFQFIIDWNGNDDHPGVVQRLAEGNARFDKIEEEISLIKAELFNNHGSSLRDAIDRIEEAVSNKNN